MGDVKLTCLLEELDQLFTSCFEAAAVDPCLNPLFHYGGVGRWFFSSAAPFSAVTRVLFLQGTSLIKCLLMLTHRLPGKQDEHCLCGRIMHTLKVTSFSLILLCAFLQSWDKI